MRTSQPTKTRPADLAAAFSERELKGQFRLTRQQLGVPDGWQERQMRGWRLAHDPELTVIQVKASGHPCGWIVGTPVWPEGQLCTEDFEWPGEAVDPDSEEIDKFVGGLGGRFVAILLLPSGPRVYLDPAGSMGLVFCPVHQIAASSPALIPYAPHCEDRMDLLAGIGQSPMFPFGLTPRGSVEWLMPNHFLDLDHWRTIRHWPSGDFEVGEVADLVAQIVEVLSASIAAVIETSPVQMSLTAGKDTRVLMACSRPWVDDITFLTFSVPARIGRIDLNVARRLAGQMGVEHHVLRPRRASEEDLDRWLYRTGHMIRAFHGQHSVRTLASMDPGLPYISGQCGEVGIARLWRKDDRATTRMTVEGLLGRMPIPVPTFPEILSRGEGWLAGLPVENAFTIMDLFYLEQWMGGWAGFLAYGAADAGEYHHYPFVNRRIFEAMLRLPPEYRRERQLVHDIIASTWPQLLAFPFNDASAGIYGAYRRLRTFARRHLKEPLLSIRDVSGTNGT